MEIQKAPVAFAAMLVRRPVAEVFEAFVDPAVTSNFWFIKGSGRLDSGKPVTWIWEMYGVSAQVEVTEIVTNEKIVARWGGAGETPSTVEWTFEPQPDGATFVSVNNFDFPGDGDAQVEQALDSTGGFTIVLNGLKAWLEQGLRLGLIADRHPSKLVPGWSEVVSREKA
jgi:uncharacterized protein YndB with AHSA1/START domain